MKLRTDLVVKDEGNLVYMTYFRGFAIIMIVMVHCVTRFLDHQNAAFPYLYAFFVHSTNLFLFISGFLFEYLQKKNYTYRTFIKKKYKRLIVPYLFWALPVALVLMVVEHKSNALEYLVYTLWTGLEHWNDAHWYINFIFMVFLLMPWLRRAIPFGKILFGLIMPVFLFFTLISTRANVGWFYSLINFIPLIGMFFLGMFFARYRTLLVYQMYKFDWLFILLGLVVCLMQGYFGLGNGIHFEQAFSNLFKGVISLNYGAVNKIFFSIGFLLLFYRITLKKIEFKFLKKLAHYSFAIYFVHLYVCTGILFILSLMGMPYSGGLFFLLLTSTAVMILSVILIYVLRQIKVTKNIIGV